MEIRRLQASHLRCFDGVDLKPGARLNYLVGPNGSGKTTILEAIYLLSHGRSFRGGGLDVLAQRGSGGFSVHADLALGGGRCCAVGLARDSTEWRLRVNGLDQSKLAAVLERCAAVCFEPGSYTLIAGGAEERRRFLDWGVFHVEHNSLACWRNWRRALRQRNALLRADSSPDEFPIWESELERFANPIETARRSYFQSLQPHLEDFASRFLPELGLPRLHYHPGWDVERSLAQLLAEQRRQDVHHGYTRLGPHRADWRVGFERIPNRDFMSRGQVKLLALACILAQASLFADRAGEWPIVCLDDPGSELDRHHQRAVFEELSKHAMQAWITTTRNAHLPRQTEATVFHVERQAVRQVGPRLRVV